MTTILEWMHPRVISDIPAIPGMRQRPNIVRRTLGSFANLLVETLRQDETAGRPGLLQSLDARAKILGLIALIVVTTIVHTLLTLLLAYLLCLAIAILSQLPAKQFGRVWLAVPLFSAAIMLPAILNVVTPGKSLVVLWHFTDGTTLTITGTGLFLATRFILRTAVCVSLAVLLTATTKSHRLFYGLRVLGVPQIFIMLLAMMERYLMVLLRAAEEIHLGKLSRSPIPGTLRQEQSWVASGIGSLFRRTQDLSNTVYLAMLSRGYTGEVRLLDEAHWHMRDWLFLTAASLIAVVLLVLK